MGGMEIIPALFHDIGWDSLLIVNEPFYPTMLYEFYANLKRARNQFGGNAITSRVNGKNIVVDGKLLNFILETPEDGMCFYTKNKQCFDQNLYSEKRFEEIFTKGIMLKRSEDRIVAKLDAYWKILHHIISNIVIPNPHNPLPPSAYRMVASLQKIFQYFEINLVGVGDRIGPSKVYNQNSFKRMGCERTNEGLFIRGGQQGTDDDDDDDDDDDEEDNGDEEQSNEPESMDDEEEGIQREMRSKKRQERTEEGQSSINTALILDRIGAMQAQLNDRLDDLNDKIVDIEYRVTRLEQGRSDTDEDEDD
ncbi:hypothetical protein M9H77_23042 [Catharanthus roseus]|uniref:Uncharacterized protein n=1 Tax=Catharanthus roseus TaxID=4058 RepID=A0ACC0AUC6_CATRO|nr:hypothetical protein M9H77_23042 [Catharanthus roseus]